MCAATSRGPSLTLPPQYLNLAWNFTFSPQSATREINPAARLGWCQSSWLSSFGSNTPAHPVNPTVESTQTCYYAYSARIRILAGKNFLANHVSTGYINDGSTMEQRWIAGTFIASTCSSWWPVVRTRTNTSEKERKGQKNRDIETQKNITEIEREKANTNFWRDWTSLFRDIEHLFWKKLSTSFGRNWANKINMLSMTCYWGHVLNISVRGLLKTALGAVLVLAGVPKYSGMVKMSFKHSDFSCLGGGMWCMFGKYKQTRGDVTCSINIENRNRCS